MWRWKNIEEGPKKERTGLVTRSGRVGERHKQPSAEQLSGS